MKFRVASEEELTSFLAHLLDKDYQSISITLDTGETLYGDIHNRTFQEYCQFTRTKSNLFPGPTPITPELLILIPDGNGGSILVHLPKQMVACVQGIFPLIDFPEGYLRNLPKEFKVSIFNHDIEVIRNNNLTANPYFEKALKNVQKIPPIIFNGFELLYVDYDFFAQRNGGLTNFGASLLGVGGSTGWKKSLNTLAIRALENKRGFLSIANQESFASRTTQD